MYVKYQLAFFITVLEDISIAWNHAAYKKAFTISEYSEIFLVASYMNNGVSSKCILYITDHLITFMILTFVKCWNGKLSCLAYFKWQVVCDARNGDQTWQKRKIRMDWFCFWKVIFSDIYKWVQWWTIQIYSVLSQDYTLLHYLTQLP